MFASVENRKLQTEQAIRKIVENKMKEAEASGCYSISLLKINVPDWLQTELKELGYGVHEVIGGCSYNMKIVISWDK